MNVLVFTSAMPERDFALYQNEAKIKPNPSNQNFYSKLIKSISLHNKVSVVSHRPLVKGMFKQKHFESNEIEDVNVKYYYTSISCGKKYKLLNEQKEITKAAIRAIKNFNYENFIIVTDTVRVSLIKAAIKISKKYNAKIIGMLTDNPENLSSTNKIVTSCLNCKIKLLDGYLSLSDGLVKKYSNNKSSYVFEGLVDYPDLFNKNAIYDYYFFAGSLYERYGVKNLVDAFHESNVKSKLIIAGSGPLAKYIEQMSYDDYRIVYVSQLPRERILSYERNALANINPRPLNEKLDNESVPSKLLEYLSNGAPILSTKFPKLFNLFKDNVYWIEDTSINGIKEALEGFDKSSKEEAKRKAYSAKVKAFEFFSIEVQAQSINNFFVSINSSTNN